MTEEELMNKRGEEPELKEKLEAESVIYESGELNEDELKKIAGGGF